MTKADLVEQVAEAIGPGITKKDCALVVDGLLNAIKKAMAEHSHIEIRGFGTFKVRKRRSRMARNPRTGDPVEVPARAVPIFKPSKELRSEVSHQQHIPVYANPCHNRRRTGRWSLGEVELELGGNSVSCLLPGAGPPHQPDRRSGPPLRRQRARQLRQGHAPRGKAGGLKFFRL